MARADRIVRVSSPANGRSPSSRWRRVASRPFSWHTKMSEPNGPSVPAAGSPQSSKSANAPSTSAEVPSPVDSRPSSAAQSEARGDDATHRRQRPLTHRSSELPKPAVTAAKSNAPVKPKSDAAPAVLVPAAVAPERNNRAVQSHHGKGDAWRSIVHGRKEGARKLMSLNLPRSMTSGLTAASLLALILIAACAAPPPPERPVGAVVRTDLRRAASITRSTTCSSRRAGCPRSIAAPGIPQEETNRLRGVIAVDPAIDGNNGQQTIASKALDARLLQRARGQVRAVRRRRRQLERCSARRSMFWPRR